MEKLQPRWRRDLMRRLTHSADLASAEVDAVFEILLAECGGRTATATATPLALEDLPSTAAEGCTLLLSVSELLNVNGLAKGQKLAFGPRLNIVYGSNGSGKTGYARIFKRACRAVDDEPVLPNIYASGRTPPQATISVATENGEEALRLDLTRKGPPLLSSVMFFDERCADIYATAETVAFTPVARRRYATARGLFASMGYKPALAQTDALLGPAEAAAL
jgi:hypothetical protein